MTIKRNKTHLKGQPLIEMRDVSKRFAMHYEANRSLQEAFIRLLQGKWEGSRHFWPLQHVSFTVHPGDSLGIIGPNGSGKSTLLKLITGILEPTSGDIITTGRISSLLELGAGFHPELTGRENIFLNGSIFGLTRRQMLQRLDRITEFAELGDFIDVPIKHYSSGMYVRLGFAVAIHTDPKLLLVDEVLAVGDAIFQHKCMDRIQQFRAQGGTLLLVSHDLNLIQSMTKQVLWLEHGAVQACGEPTDVVMTYLDHMARREQEALNGTPGKAVSRGEHRWGSGRIDIERVEVSDGSAANNRIFATGCPLEIRLHYRSQERVKDPVFGLAIHQQNGPLVSGPNSGLAGLVIPYVEGEGTVTYRLPSLPLLDGAYVLSVSSHNREDTEMYDYHDRIYPFRVYPAMHARGYGMVDLDGHWQIQPGTCPKGDSR